MSHALLEPQPFSWKRLLNAGVAELPRDINGQRPSPHYESYLQLTQVYRVRSLAGYMPGVWLGRQLQLTSLGEIRCAWGLEANRFVIDIRENYPMLSPEVLKALMEEEDIARNKVWTLDFVLTMVPERPLGPLRYMALSRKPEGGTESPAAKRRARREAEACARIGWKWAYIDSPSAQCYDNLLNLRAWALAESLDVGAADAQKLAAALYSTTSTKPLSSLLPMLCKRYGIPEERPYYLLACAYYLGFIALDHTRPVNERSALPLMALA